MCFIDVLLQNSMYGFNVVYLVLFLKKMSVIFKNGGHFDMFIWTIFTITEKIMKRFTVRIFTKRAVDSPG